MIISSVRKFEFLGIASKRCVAKFSSFQISLPINDLYILFAFMNQKILLAEHIFNFRNISLISLDIG